MAEYVDKQTALEIIASFRTPYRKEVRVEDVYDAVSKAETVTINDLTEKIKVTNCNYNQFADVSKKGDLINREDALNALGEEPPVWYDGEDEIAERNQWRRDVKAIEGVPSAQSEIIRCGECKHWDRTWTTIEGFHYCPNVDGQREGEYYCADAERRTDE